MRNPIRVMAAVLGLVVASWAGAEAPPQVPQSRVAYLKLIDRPRVDPAATEKEMESPGAGLKMSRLEFNSEAGQRVPAILVWPENVKPGTRLPVVITLHGTGSKKESNLGLCKKLAAKGFMAVSPDGRYHGERKTGEGATTEYFAQIAKAFEDNAKDAGPGKAHPWLFDTTWDVMRLVDVLSGRADVDPKRIGLIGFSKGGMECYLTAAADARIAAAVPCIGVQTFKYGLEGDGWKGRVGTVKGAFEAAAKGAGVAKPDAAFAKQFYDRVIPGIDGILDGPSVLPTIAPRPLLVINGDTDDKTPLPGVRLAAEAARKAYEAAGAGDRFELVVQEKTGHKVNPENMQRAVDWFVRWLGAGK